MGCNVSDEEFDTHLVAIYEAWEAGGVDTVDIARRVGISEAKVECILTCYLEGKFDQMYEARDELAKWPGFDPAAIVSQASTERFKAMPCPNPDWDKAHAEVQAQFSKTLEYLGRDDGQIAQARVSPKRAAWKERQRKVAERKRQRD